MVCSQGAINRKRLIPGGPAESRNLGLEAPRPRNDMFTISNQEEKVNSSRNGGIRESGTEGAQAQKWYVHNKQTIGKGLFQEGRAESRNLGLEAPRPRNGTFTISSQ